MELSRELLSCSCWLLSFKWTYSYIKNNGGIRFFEPIYWCEFWITKCCHIMKNCCHHWDVFIISPAVKQSPCNLLKISWTPCGLVISLNCESFEIANDIFFFLFCVDNHLLKWIDTSIVGLKENTCIWELLFGPKMQCLWGVRVCNIFCLKVIYTRLSCSQSLTHLAALSIAMELVAMAAE